MKLEHIVVYENISDKFDNGHCRIKVKVTVGFEIFVILRKVGEVQIFKHRLYISALEQAKVLLLGKYVLLGVINTIHKQCHA